MEGNLPSPVKERVTKASKRVTEYAHQLANEPSVGLFHVQTHLSKAVPKIVEAKGEIEKGQRAGQDLLAFIDDSRETVQTLDSLQTFNSIEEKVRSSIALLEELTAK